jgi:predicted Holliday junction resolvase-like endonuclease
METLIFLIIVGIISTIFGKGKIKSQSMGKTFLPNGFDEIKTLIQKQMEHTTTAVHEVSKPFEKMEETIEEKYHQVKENLEKQTEVIDTEQIQSIPVIDSKNHLSQDQKNIITNDSNTILNGLIWSEILGEPRSRKPHFPRK